MRAIIRVVVCAVMAIITVAPTGPSAAAASASVVAMSAPVYQRVNGASQANLVTVWADEASGAAAYGFTTDLGRPFQVSMSAATGLSPVRRFFRSDGQFAWAVQGSSTGTALLAAGYVDQHTDFFAAPTAVGAETQPVVQFVKGAVRRLALDSSAATMTAAGWTREAVVFHVPLPAAPPPPPSPTPAAGSAGSLPVGGASYALPAAGIYVAPWGSDAAAGSSSSPVRSLARAVALVPSGGTVVLRAGTYHERDVVVAKPMTIQAYPSEAVWLDGSETVTGWVADGAGWRRDGWTVRFDSSPTYTQGAPDGAAPYWQFVNPSQPMAAHPDQVFVNGAPMRQVASRGQVTQGSFFLDTATSQLYLGSNPTGATVAASTYHKALSIRTSDVTIKGIGVRRFSPSVFHMGSITVEGPRVRFENVVVEDSATTGVSVLREDCSLDRVTIRRSGMLGLQGRFADRLVLARVLSEQNNVERFNIAPVAGGVKLGQTRGVTVRDSSFVGNYGHGFWEDMSVYNSTFANSAFTDNVGTGLFLEISAKKVVVSNLIARNQEFGIKVNNTSDVQIWNNTFVGNGRPLNLVQDSRRNTNRSDPAVDPRVAWPDPAMPWTLGNPLVVRNNVVAQSTTAANCLLCVEDYSFQMTGQQMGVSANSNVYHRASTSQPTWISVWSRGTTVNPYVFTTLAQLQATVGQETRGREFVGSAIVDSAGALTPAVASLASSIAEPLPASIASIAGQPAGSVRLGKF
ncbi:MAG TPA: right-handed parallel beta-helix repeat-containing protein [Dermatophilaceae bacterium]|mgnify:CR=1 FL=1|nr:right-handed parallel beta-helix repeat-containing protein [Dermatophilaceae bacterium]